MEIACNVKRHIPLLTELVNVATALRRYGSPVAGRADDQLVTTLELLHSKTIRSAFRELPDAESSLRSLAWSLREALLADTPAAKADRINAMMQRYDSRPYLVEDVGQPFHLHFHGAKGTVVDWLGGELAAALALVVDEYGTDRFGQCEAARCDGIYVDLTKNGSRRYCSSSCAARAKAAAYRARKSSPLLSS